MASLDLSSTLKTLQRERAQTQKKLTKLDRAIDVIRELAGPEGAPNALPALPARDVRSEVGGLLYEFLERKARVDADGLLFSHLGQFDTAVIVGSLCREANPHDFGPLFNTHFGRSRLFRIGQRDRNRLGWQPGARVERDVNCGAVVCDAHYVRCGRCHRVAGDAVCQSHCEVEARKIILREFEFAADQFDCLSRRLEPVVVLQVGQHFPTCP